MNVQKPYYTVIFTNRRTAGDNGYSEMAQQMGDLAKKQPGYMGSENARISWGFR
jgi:antibiotic biosynthesis monooxygenase (ABM) superfamily enzyme